MASFQLFPKRLGPSDHTDGVIPLTLQDTHVIGLNRVKNGPSRQLTVGPNPKSSGGRWRAWTSH